MFALDNNPLAIELPSSMRKESLSERRRRAQSLIFSFVRTLQDFAQRKFAYRRRQAIRYWQIPMFSEESTDGTDREQQSSDDIARVEQTIEFQGSSAVDHCLQTTDCVEVPSSCSRRVTFWWHEKMLAEFSWETISPSNASLLAGRSPRSNGRSTAISYRTNAMKSCMGHFICTIFVWMIAALIYVEHRISTGNRTLPIRLSWKCWVSDEKIERWVSRRVPLVNRTTESDSTAGFVDANQPRGECLD